RTVLCRTGAGTSTFAAPDQCRRSVSFVGRWHSGTNSGCHVRSSCRTSRVCHAITHTASSKTKEARKGLFLCPGVLRHSRQLRISRPLSERQTGSHLFSQLVRQRLKYGATLFSELLTRLAMHKTDDSGSTGSTTIQQQTSQWTELAVSEDVLVRSGRNRFALRGDVRW